MSKHKEPISIISLDTYLFPKDSLFDQSCLVELVNTHPHITQDFFYYIFRLDTTNLVTPINVRKINYFSQQHRRLSDTLNLIVGDWHNEITLLYKMLANYKEKFKVDTFTLPTIVTYTAPIDIPAIALFSNWIGVNVTLFGSESFPLYHVYEFISVFPTYLHHRLNKSYVPYFIWLQIIQDQHPIKEKNHSLMEKMINNGKYWYVLQELSPNKNDDRISMFTPEQLKWCVENESKIWSYLRLAVKDLYTTAPNIIRNYIGEAPTTNGMPDQSPGNIGSWIGLQIVNAFMSKTNISIEELIDVNAYQLFQKSNYRPQ